MEGISSSLKTHYAYGKIKTQALKLERGARNMYCPNCGFNNDDNCNFCVNCGTPLGAAPQEEPARSGGHPHVEREDYYEQDEGESKKNNVPFIIAVVGIALVLGAAAFGIVHFLLGSHSSPSEPPIVTETEPDISTEPSTQDWGGGGSDSDSNGGSAGSSYSSNDYIIPDSDSRRLTNSDVSGLSQREIQYAINEIYARHGAEFTDPDVQAYFNSKDWYYAYQSKDAAQDDFSQIELDNVDLLSEYRQ